MALSRVRIYRVFSIFFCTLLLFTWSTATMAYSDIDGHWAEDAVRRWRDEYGLLQSVDGRFRPAAEVTRAEVAMLLDRLFCYPDAPVMPFTDVPEDAVYAGAVARLANAGVFLGDGGLARPMDTITREQAVTLLARAFGFDLNLAGLAADAYRDADEIADWAYDAVSIMTEKGYMQGNENRFQPKSTITRAEMITIFDNIFGEIYSGGGVYSEYQYQSVVVNADEPVLLRNMTIRGNLYIAHNVTNPVTLDDVVVQGEIRNFSGVELLRFSAQSEPTPPQDSILYASREIPVVEGLARNPYRSEQFYRDERGYLRYDTAHYDTMVGVDVSAWQKDIDWDLAAEQGIDYAMIRVGNRGYTEGGLKLDEYFVKNIEGALDAGLEVGVYFFSQAISEQEAREEAQFVLDAIAGYEISFPVVFDWEPVTSDSARTNGLSADVLSYAAVAFCEEVEAAGYTPMIYYNLQMAYLHYDLSVIDGYDVWLAQYAELPEYYYDFQMWQYTSDGTVPGIPGAVDLNISFVNYAKD